MKKIAVLIVFLTAFCFPALAQMETPVDVKDRLGIYHWGGAYLAKTDEPLLEGAERVKESTRVINIVISPYSDYKLGERFEPSSLTLRVRQADYTTVLCDPAFSTIVITAFDWTTYPAAFRHLPQDRELRNQILGMVSAEFSDLVLYIATVCNGQNKTIIIKDWEVENSLQININSLEPDVDKTAQWQSYLDYIEARQRGVVRGRERAQERGRDSVRFYNAVETANIAGLLNGQLEKSVLWQMAQRGLAVDLVSYSSWQSLWRPDTGSTPLGVYLWFKNDLDKILDFIKTNKIAGKLFVGEFGIHYTYGVELLRYAYDAIEENEDVVLAVKWNLHNTEEGWLGFFGNYDGEGKITEQGRFMSQLLNGELPRINIGGVIDNVTHKHQIVSGVIEIYGQNLPEKIEETKVQLTNDGVNYFEAEVLYASAVQINARPVLPEFESKTVYIRVNNSNFQPIFIGTPSQ